MDQGLCWNESGLPLLCGRPSRAHYGSSRIVSVCPVQARERSPGEWRTCVPVSISTRSEVAGRQKPPQNAACLGYMVTYGWRIARRPAGYAYWPTAVPRPTRPHASKRIWMLCVPSQDGVTTYMPEA